jgi:RNA polymerase sigma-70 factor (ECF subfamily)
VSSEPFFRRAHARVVAGLTRLAGTQHFAAIEDAAQTALESALVSWPRAGQPQDPEAWLFRAAKNAFISELRNETRRAALLEKFRDVPTDNGDAGEGEEDLLRMLFVCCDEAMPVESQLAIALKTLCGFGVEEIAERLFTSEMNVYKRLERARTRLREAPFELSAEQLAARVPSVRAVLYAMFAEGHLSTQAEGAIRRELCSEALRLADLLAAHPDGGTPETLALLALMHLHTARMPARQDGAGGLLLLEEQDRSLWDQRQIQAGLACLARSAEGDTFSRFHAEAGIAAEHCLAPTFAETRWGRIVECYELLERVAPSPLHRLNRAVAVAELRGPREGLRVLEGLEPPSWLEGSYLWAAVLADLHRRGGDAALAARHRNTALESAPSDTVRAALRRRLEVDSSSGSEALANDKSPLA